MTLPISDCLFHLEGGTIPPCCTLQFLPFMGIRVNRVCISIVFACNLLKINTCVCGGGGGGCLYCFIIDAKVRC